MMLSELRPRVVHRISDKTPALTAEQKRGYSQDWWNIKGRTLRLARRRAKRAAQQEA